MVGELAPGYSCEIAGVVDPLSKAHTAALDDPRWKGAGDVAIDFTTPDAVVGNVTALAAQGIALAPARAERLARGLSIMLAEAAADRQRLQPWMAPDDDVLSWQAAALAGQRAR